MGLFVLGDRDKVLVEGTGEAGGYEEVLREIGQPLTIEGGFEIPDTCE